MTEHQHEYVRRLFDLVLDVPAAQREAILDRECGGDDGLKQRILAMIEAAEDSKFLVDAPDATADITATAKVPTGEHAGQSIDRYKLLQPIGEGGFGTVWMAEQREPVKRRVALKVIKLGMDTKQVIARFEAERQALAMMDHPNIAKVLDAGTTETGRPFFIMELVKGVPILEYCDTERLDTEARLSLFMQVCHAIQHAHQKGIIHRDIKPSNVLVTLHDGVPVPKVIDFGIAKATNFELTEKTLFTLHRHMIGTPAYMSPEQMEMSGLDIDTRSDIYSLGVLLYELLTGTTPFTNDEIAQAGLDGLRRLIREVDPPKPSTRLSSLGDTAQSTAQLRRSDPRRLLSAVRGDLDWIIMRCLEKDRTRRYETANGLAADVLRHLDDEPVEAGPPSTGYRLRKFARRNRGQVATAAAVVLALAIGLGAAVWQAGVARQEAEAARAAEAEKSRLAEAEAAARRIADERAAEAQTERAKAVAAKEQIEYNSYVSNVQLAGEAMENRQFDRVRQRLEACPEHLRGWEWHWLNATADSSIAELVGHTAAITSAAFSPDGTRIVTTSMDFTARVWDVATGEAIVELVGHKSPIHFAEFNPDSNRIVTVPRAELGTLTDAARLWDTETGELLAELSGHTSPLTHARFSPDGTRLVTASWDRTARIWDTATGQLLTILTGHKYGVTHTEFSPDSNRVFTFGLEDSVRVWNAATGELLAELAESSTGGGPRDFAAKAESFAKSFGSANGGISFIAFNPDGTRYVVMPGVWGETPRIYDVATGVMLTELAGHTGWRNFATFSADGSRIVTATGDETARVWDPVSGALLVELVGHTKGVVSADFSKDNSRIVTASSDGTARIWDASTGRMLGELFGHAEMVTSAVFSPDGARILTTSMNGTARIWDATVGTPAWERDMRHPRRRVKFAAFDSDGSRIITAGHDGAATVWDVKTGSILSVFAGPPSALNSASFGPDGTRIVTASDDDTAWVWNIKNITMETRLVGHVDDVESAVFNQRGTQIVTGSSDATARVWDSATGDLYREISGHTGRVNTAAFSSDGTRIVTASDDGTARIWDASTGQSLILLWDQMFPVRSAAFNPDGTWVVAASDDFTARVWDAATGNVLVELTGHTGPVNSAAFSPDGTRIITVSDDQTARVWDAATGRALGELKRHILPVESGEFSPDGTQIITASRDGTVRVWDSVPYRDRYPAIKTARESLERVRPLVHARLDRGESLESIRSWAASDRSLAEVDRRAYLIVTQALLDGREHPTR